MKNTLLLSLLSFLFFSCDIEKSPQTLTSKTLKERIEWIKNPDTSYVMVIAHRGDWRHAPENSLQAIRNCIDMGVDMVEIDVRMTKDSVLVLMHDETIDRTTTGTGLLADWTMDSLQTLYLKNGAGHPTHHKIPTLKEALQTSKGKIMLNLDKCYDYFDEVYPMLKETKTTDHILMKGWVTKDQLLVDFQSYLEDILYMPVIRITNQGAAKYIEDYLKGWQPVAFEFTFEKEHELIQKFGSIRKKGMNIWANSLWEDLNAGYEDDMAVHNPDSIYGWFVKNEVNMIQTDRPRLLLDYLRSKGLHD